ncbi:F-box/kelch-repeat protein [Cardamine amara subsp. amara]|uniref:F-box/kelch-repeat protein n=1 Tax=Cardamine amara subsp. amara TaxID=228776 RepID=A0ABD1B6W8_CARAN
MKSTILTLIYGGISRETLTGVLQKRYLEDDIYIVCFDFTRERFVPLLLLPFSAREDHDNVVLSCVREENLAALFQQHELIEIWITTKIETEKLSWSKFLKVNTVPEFSFKIHSFIIDEEKKIAMCFDEWNRHSVNIIGEAGYFRQLDVGEPAGIKYSSNWCLYYVPSLNSANQAASRCNRKKDKAIQKSFSNKSCDYFPLPLFQSLVLVHKSFNICTFVTLITVTNLVCQL